MRQAAAERLCLVARILASSTLPPDAPSGGGQGATGPASGSANGGGGGGGGGANVSRLRFAVFLERMLARPASEVRRLAEQGPTHWATKVKDVTYQLGQHARHVGVL